ncbi:MAG: Gfo/Idh/MocA family oxidoreductase [Planctomycetota bacterium]
MKTMTSPNRRRFMQATATTLAAGYWTGTAPKTIAQPSALNGLSAACIGVGGKGKVDSEQLAGQGVSIVGLCDVDQELLNKKASVLSSAAKFDDFRECLDQLGDKIDLVTVSTPDHTHAVAATDAMRRGKHVYCQKPLTWSIREARVLRELAADKGVVTQMGNQGTAEDGFRESIDVIRSGAIGDVTEVHAWTNRPVWPQGDLPPADAAAVPKTLNWDNWIGPAPMRPFVPERYHTFAWRGWFDFGTGALGDMACHTVNMPAMALKLFDPMSVTCLSKTGESKDGQAFPERSTVRIEFPQRERFGPCDFYWYDGGDLPGKAITDQLPDWFQPRIAKHLANPSDRGSRSSGVVLIGTKGVLFSPDDYGAKYILLPSDQYVDYMPPQPVLPRIPVQQGRDANHMWEFVQTIQGEYAPGTLSNFDYAGRVTETVLLGVLALRSQPGTRILWDSQTLTSPSHPAMNEFVHRDYRPGWSI